MARFFRPAGALAALLLVLAGGCPNELEDVLDEIELEIDNSVGVLQTVDPRSIPPPPVLVQQGDTIIIDQDVQVITDVSEQLVVSELPDATLLIFDNLTGYDIYIRYEVDLEPQGIFVFDGEALLLDYPCLGSIELLTEDDFLPGTDVFVDSFDLLGGLFLNPDDFICGEALILTFDQFGVSAELERIDLLR